MPRKVRIDMTALRFGRLVGVAFSHISPSGRAQWLFACDCGVEVVIDGGNVRAGNSTSCGCYHREVSAARLTTHGHRRGRRHEPTYRAWQRMIDACANPRSPSWSGGGGRGAAVAARWLGDFPTFLADLGERPVGSILARRDPDGDFTPENCAWVERPARGDRAQAGWATRRAAPSRDAASRGDGAGVSRRRPLGSPPPAMACVAAPVP